jgi:hypothetical protein
MNIPAKEFSQSKKIFQSTWFIALFLFGIYLLISGYTYGWDDQHLEITMLKSLIDPTFYQGDYYVETLKQNFPSYFYRILSKLISVEQIPAAYFILYLISRYFLFLFTYKLWLHISKSSFKAVCAVLTFILMVRVDEFLYRTFSHQEFALAFIMAGIYYFFKERFILASLILGFAANIHGIYALFPMMFLMVYLLWDVRKHGWMTLIKSGLVFLLTALPFIILVLHNRLSASQAVQEGEGNWLSLYILACPQNFLFPAAPLIPFEKLTESFKNFYYFTQDYLFIAALFLLNCFGNKNFRRNKKALAYCGTAFFILIVWSYFAYIHPNRLVLDLNLGRNTQFLLFLLVGYTVIFIVDMIEEGSLTTALLFGVLFSFLKFTPLISTLALCMIFLAVFIIRMIKQEKNLVRSLLLTVDVSLIGLLGLKIALLLQKADIRSTMLINLSGMYVLFIGCYVIFRMWKTDKYVLLKKYAFIIIPLFIYTVQYTCFHYVKIQTERHGDGFWKLQRNWEDMQHYVHDHTEKEAIILTPYNMEMGGFRIFSERKVVVCYRDIGVIGFDYSAAVEWMKRIKDVEPFKVMVTEPIIKAIQNGITKYNANYIVFMRYARPTHDTSLLKHIYTNEEFCLYKVNR